MKEIRSVSRAKIPRSIAAVPVLIHHGIMAAALFRKQQYLAVSLFAEGMFIILAPQNIHANSGQNCNSAVFEISPGFTAI